MEAIRALTNINFSYVFISVFVILAAVKAVISLFEWIVKKLGLETSWMRAKRKDHELLTTTSKNLVALQERHEEDIKRSDVNDAEIQKDIKELKDLFMQKEIEDIRWYINSFANQISEGYRCNKDSFKHCLKMHMHYMEILKNLDMTNGEVEISMSIIKKAYEKKMAEGF